jgi:multicomponent Na+:H+ antiporter subunit B
VQGLKALALLASLITGAILLYGVQDFAPWGDPASPASTHVSSHYIQNSVKETHVPNVVTAVLGDYRGYDTMFETVVIFCAGMAVVCVLRRSRQ